MRTNSNQSRLTASDVLDIRRLASETDESGNRVYNDADLSREFGVSRKAIYNIRNRYTWNHVPEPRSIRAASGYVAFPDGRIMSKSTGNFIKVDARNGRTPTVRLTGSSGRRVSMNVQDILTNTFGRTLAS